MLPSETREDTESSRSARRHDWLRKEKGSAAYHLLPGCRIGHADHYFRIYGSPSQRAARYDDYLRGRAEKRQLHPPCCRDHRGQAPCRTTSVTNRSNQALERTAAHRAFTFQMIKTVSIDATLALGSGRSAYSR